MKEIFLSPWRLRIFIEEVIKVSDLLNLDEYRCLLTTGISYQCAVIDTGIQGYGHSYRSLVTECSSKEAFLFFNKKETITMIRFSHC